MRLIVMTPHGRAELLEFVNSTDNTTHGIVWVEGSDTLEEFPIHEIKPLRWEEFEDGK